MEIIKERNMDEHITQERAPNVVSELLVVIRNSETRREALERENMQLREDNRRLQSRVTELQIQGASERPDIHVMGHSPTRNTRRRAATRPAIHPISPL